MKGTPHIREYDTTHVGDQVLTPAATVSVDVSGYANIQSSRHRGDGIVNDGAIDVTGSGGDLIIDPRTFTNNGSIDVANSDSVTIKPAVTGTGTDTISGSSTLEFDKGVSTSKREATRISTSPERVRSLSWSPRVLRRDLRFRVRRQVELTLMGLFLYLHAHGVTALTLDEGSTTHGFEFVGDYTPSDFSITPGTITTIGYA